MSAPAAKIAHDELQVIEDDEGPVPDVHDGRPQRPEYAERGALFQLFYELDRGAPV